MTGAPQEYCAANHYKHRLKKRDFETAVLIPGVPGIILKVEITLIGCTALILRAALLVA